MIDQSHNLKGKMEAMVQSVVTAQELFARAAMIDREALTKLQDECRVVESEELFRDCFWTDVRPMVRAWREAKGLPSDPLGQLRENGYVDRIAAERAQKNRNSVSSYA
jgi:L-rhamnose isomerase/sugar isomerase